MSQSCFQTLLARVLDSCIQPVNSNCLTNYTSVVEQIMTILPMCNSFRNAISSAASSDELQGKIWRLVKFTIVDELSTCHTYTASLHQQMISAVIALLLTLAVTTQPSEPAFPAELATALVNKQRQLPRIVSQCSHTMAAIKPTVVSLFQQKSTQITGQHLQDWRERLNSEIETQGSFQRDSILRSVAQICQDLESRCDTVEEPLRREKKKVQELEQHVIELNEKMASFEVRAADDLYHSEGLEDEKNSLTKERDDLLARLESLQAEFVDAVRNADETLTRVQEDFHAKELELQSTILARNNTIHTYEKDVEAQAEMVKNLEHDLTQAQDEQTSLSELVETLQHQLGDIEKKLVSEVEAGRTQSEEITQLNNMKVELELQLQGTEADLETITMQLNELQVTHRELVQASEDAYRDLENKYDRDMQAATAQAENNQVDFDFKLQEALHRGQGIEAAHNETQRNLQKLQASIPLLEEKIKELTGFCSEQEEELDELRTLRRNVLASVNFAAQPTLAKRSASRGQTNAAEVQTYGAPREHRRRKSAIQTMVSEQQDSRSTQDATNVAAENFINTSFASSDSYSSRNGSTPKRPKPRPSSKVPAMHTPHTRKLMSGSQSVSKRLSPIKRSVLRQMSPNRRHTTVGFAAADNDEEHSRVLRSGRKRRSSLQEVEEAETDFEMEDFLADTPLTPGNFVAGTGRIPDDDDVTATEL
jgi:predicted  nucleic acid-binding Zn-ribbon protein